jgi:uncharacterized membrane protein YccC
MAKFDYLRLKPAQLKHAFKTALAAVLAYALTQALNLPQGYWAVISVVVVMQANLGGSLKAGWSRILGTAVGAALGALTLSVLQPSHLALGLGTGLAILVCAYFTYLHESFRLAGLTASIVILMGQEGESYWTVAATRFLEIAVGVGVALAVSLLVWPSRAGRQLRLGVAKALRQEAQFYRIILDCRLASDCEKKAMSQARADQDQTLRRNLGLLNEAKNEPTGLSKQEHISISLHNFTERIASHLRAMEHALRGEGRGLEILHDEIHVGIDLLGQATVAAMENLALSIELRKHPGQLEELRKALETAEGCLTRVRKQQILASYDLDTVMRFMAYYYNLRQVAVELTGMAERTELLAQD